MFNKRISSLAAIIALLFAGAALAKDDMPEVTEDGLMRIDSKSVDAVYWLDGATLDIYNKVLIIDAQVAFRKNWQRDYNRNAISLSQRARASDMEKIKQGLSEEFTRVFAEELTKGGYEVVEEPDIDVLVLRPAIVNLDVTAPDLNSTSLDRTYVASAGQMTLYLEMFDSASGAKIGTVLDTRRARDSGMMRYSNKISNRQEAISILKKWSGLLVQALDEAHKKDD